MLSSKGVAGKGARELNLYKKETMLPPPPIDRIADTTKKFNDFEFE